jgi:hypothetical protein
VLRLEDHCLLEPEGGAKGLGVDEDVCHLQHADDLVHLLQYVQALLQVAVSVLHDGWLAVFPIGLADPLPVLLQQLEVEPRRPPGVLGRLDDLAVLVTDRLFAHGLAIKLIRAVGHSCLDDVLVQFLHLLIEGLGVGVVLVVEEGKAERVEDGLPLVLSLLDALVRHYPGRLEYEVAAGRGRIEVGLEHPRALGHLLGDGDIERGAVDVLEVERHFANLVTFLRCRGFSK